MTLLWHSPFKNSHAHHLKKYGAQNLGWPRLYWRCRVLPKHEWRCSIRLFSNTESGNPQVTIAIPFLATKTIKLNPQHAWVCHCGRTRSVLMYLYMVDTNIHQSLLHIKLNPRTGAQERTATSDTQHALFNSWCGVVCRLAEPVQSCSSSTYQSSIERQVKMHYNRREEHVKQRANYINGLGEEKMR